MTLVRVAEIAENGVKNTVFEQPRNPPMQTFQLQRQEYNMNENPILEQLERETSNSYKYGQGIKRQAQRGFETDGRE